MACLFLQHSIINKIVLIGKEIIRFLSLDNTVVVYSIHALPQSIARTHALVQPCYFNRNLISVRH